MQQSRIHFFFQLTMAALLSVIYFNLLTKKIGKQS